MWQEWTAWTRTANRFETGIVGRIRVRIGGRSDENTQPDQFMVVSDDDHSLSLVAHSFHPTLRKHINARTAIASTPWRIRVETIEFPYVRKCLQNVVKSRVESSNTRKRLASTVLAFFRWSQVYAFSYKGPRLNIPIWLGTETVNKKIDEAAHLGRQKLAIRVDGKYRQFVGFPLRENAYQLPLT